MYIERIYSKRKKEKTAILPLICTRGQNTYLKNPLPGCTTRISYLSKVEHIQLIRQQHIRTFRAPKELNGMERKDSNWRV